MQNTPPRCGGLTLLRLHLMRGLHTLSPHHVDRAALLPAGCSERQPKNFHALFGQLRLDRFRMTNPTKTHVKSLYPLLSMNICVDL
jgi:hypothetical protein